MKKIFSLILAVMMIATMSTTAFAAEGSGTVGENNGSQTITVSGTYTAASGELEPVVSVAISWGSMEFTYTAGGQTWDTTNHLYTTSEGTWTCAEGANIITISNHSNIGIEIASTFTSSVEGVTGEVCETWEGVQYSDTTNLTAAAAAGWYGTTNAPTTNFIVEITGGSISADTETLGTVTLTISTIGSVKNNN